MQAASISQPDANKLLAASRGEFVEGISDPNDPKWVKGIETRDSVHQNQSETEQYDQKRNKTAKMRYKTSQKRNNLNQSCNRKRKKFVPHAIRLVVVTALIVAQ